MCSVEQAQSSLIVTFSVFGVNVCVNRENYDVPSSPAEP